MIISEIKIFILDGINVVIWCMLLKKNFAKTFNDDFCLVYPVEKLDKLIVIKDIAVNVLWYVIVKRKAKSLSVKESVYPIKKSADFH